MLYVVGAGGFGREVHDALTLGGRDVDAFLDENLVGTVVCGRPVLHPTDVSRAGTFIIGIANPIARKRLAKELGARLEPSGPVVHPAAVVAASSSIGPGSVVLANATVSIDVSIGTHVHINYNATIGHDVVLDEFVTILPGANIGGGVAIGAGATVGAGACVLQGISLERGCFVGAGAVVVQSVPQDQVVKGIPAR
jgi:sugar O-acyltransferase (sialic acid O-acetyltransferase NeuD family)